MLETKSDRLVVRCPVECGDGLEETGLVMDGETRRLRAEARRLARDKHPGQVRYPDRLLQVAAVIGREPRVFPPPVPGSRGYLPFLKLPARRSAGSVSEETLKTAMKPFLTAARPS